jgi:hypothetical protein
MFGNVFSRPSPQEISQDWKESVVLAIPFAHTPSMQGHALSGLAVHKLFVFAAIRQTCAALDAWPWNCPLII